MQDRSVGLVFGLEEQSAAPVPSPPPPPPGSPSIPPFLLLTHPCTTSLLSGVQIGSDQSGLWGGLNQLFSAVREYSTPPHNLQQPHFFFFIFIHFHIFIRTHPTLILTVSNARGLDGDHKVGGSNGVQPAGRVGSLPHG